MAAFESGGGVAASLLVSRLINRVNWRLIALIGIIIAMTANLASIYIDVFHALGLARATAGFGSGMIYAMGLGILATTQNTGRNFSILLFTQVSFGMIELNLFAYLAEHWGMPGIYLGIVAALLCAAALLPWLPRANSVKTASVHAAGFIKPRKFLLMPWLCLCAVFIFYISTSSFWSYIELIGRSGGLSAGFVTGSLTYTQVLSLLGCVLAGWLSSRIGQSRPLLVALLCATLAIYSLSLGITAVSFVAALCVFFLFWNAIDIYQLGTLSNMDHSGQFVAMVPAFQMTAGALGPALAAMLVEQQGDYQAVLLMAALGAACALLLYLYVYLRRRATVPTVAGAA